jgi:hypothetical protein
VHGVAVGNDFARRLLNWQRNALADRELELPAILLACAISSATEEPDAWLSHAELRGLIRAPAAKITAAIDQLVHRGHLEGRSTKAAATPRAYRPCMSVTAPTSARPVAKITAFPLARRGPFIRKHAARMAELSAAQADAHIRQVLTVQALTLHRRGIPQHEIAREIRDLESTIKAEEWWCVLGVEKPGGDAG